MRTQTSKANPFLAISLAGFLLAAVLLLAACGSNKPSPGPDYTAKLAGSPPKLAAIHKQANELLPGGLDAYNARIAGLKGYPVVVNVWGSWCGPCQAEFPHFQNASANMGKKVAFLGVNSADSADAAKDFLKEDPVSYPSYSDNDSTIKKDVEANYGLPATVFYDAEGNRTYTKSGQYTSTEDLENDIREHAINGGGTS